MVSEQEPGQFPELLARCSEELDLPAYLPSLAAIEYAADEVRRGPAVPRWSVDGPEINPSLRILPQKWKHLPGVIAGHAVAPDAGDEMVLVWRLPAAAEVMVRAATADDLLPLKIVAEHLQPAEVAAEGGVPVVAVQGLIDRAVQAGLLLAPASRLRRDPAVVPSGEERFLMTGGFTLQWHLTQACDLHCRHCYDRSDRPAMPLDAALRVIDDLAAFCRDRRVSGQISFSGGNPLLYPNFDELYRASAAAGFGTAILGNPASRERLQSIIAIQMPSFCQVSLEGLAETNDYMRGSGHFQRVMDFLDLLRELGVYSMVMLTLTDRNVDEVIPLARVLQGRADTFNFNRLAMVGEGANLCLPPKDRYGSFLREYVDAARELTVMGFKDNLLGILCDRDGREQFGGCTGYGCGAAFNFISLLPDGEAHACRKFPSPIGNMLEQGIAGVYDSAMAERYRCGSAACAGCELRAVCGGCLAVTYGHGLDVFTARDPYCFCTGRTPGN